MKARRYEGIVVLDFHDFFSSHARVTALETKITVGASRSLFLFG